MLSMISILTGASAGTLAFIAAGKTPDKAVPLRRLGTGFFCMAGLMAALTFF